MNVVQHFYEKWSRILNIISAVFAKLSLKKLFRELWPLSNDIWSEHVPHSKLHHMGKVASSLGKRAHHGKISESGKIWHFPAKSL